jgi:hypothetical protein
MNLAGIEGAGDGMTATEIFQFRPHLAGETAEDIPTLSQWGLILLGLLLVTAGAVVIARRRKVEA